MPYGVPFNTTQYAMLMCKFARHLGVEPGILTHVIADAHIYDRHIDTIKELISRPTYPAPDFWLNPEKKSFYDFTKDDVRLDNYEFGPQITNIPVAV